MQKSFVQKKGDARKFRKALVSGRIGKKDTDLFKTKPCGAGLYLACYNSYHDKNVERVAVKSAKFVFEDFFYQLRLLGG